MSKRGAFIAIEGLDRSGKSTQASALIKRLEAANVPCKHIKFPDRTTPIGKMIDSYLQSKTELDDHVIHLLFSANRWELASSIVKALEEGTTVVCDRYAFSGIAFSAAKVLPRETTSKDGDSTIPIPTHVLSYEWCRAPEISLPAPDLTFLLEVSPEKAESRGGYGEERIGEEIESSGVGKWVVLDADLDKDEVEQSVWDEVKPFIEHMGVSGPVRKLWDKTREAAMVDALYI
ncbi:unnamed protein product [Somion occarium]|uniref:dTMP kinase n=1 Tax=Somion occarium TaxID=3059160 RepID=A0ABP1E5M9_9APHY